MAAMLEISGHGLILERLVRPTRIVSYLERCGKPLVSPTMTVGLPPPLVLSIQNLVRGWRDIRPQQSPSILQLGSWAHLLWI